MLKQDGDDKIANDIEGFLEVYDEGGEDNKEGAFDLIEPIEEGKAGSVLKHVKSTIRNKKLPIPRNVYDDIKKQYNKLRVKLKELSKTAKNEKENFDYSRLASSINQSVGVTKTLIQPIVEKQIQTVQSPVSVPIPSKPKIIKVSKSNLPPSVASLLK